MKQLLSPKSRIGVWVWLVIAFINASLTYWHWRSHPKASTTDILEAKVEPSPSVNIDDVQHFTWVGDDFPLYYPMPPLPTVAMTLYDSAHYDLSPPPSLLPSSSHFSPDDYTTLLNESNHEWALLGTTPAGFGRTRLGPEQRMFVLTVYHHMHCVRKLEVALLDRSDSISTFHHALHCLNYLRQGFLCAAHEGLEEGDWMQGWGPEDWELLGYEGGPPEGVEVGEEGSGYKQGVIRGEMICEDWERAYDVFDKNHERFVEWRNEWN